MKKILSIAVLLISLSVSAQGNLQFNQVINAEVVGTGTFEFNMGSITVPAGKVWKIESTTLSYTNFSISSLPTNILPGSTTINVSIGRHLAYGGASQHEAAKMPLWLPSGTYDLTNRTQNSTSYSYTFAISAIEFNVVP